VPNLVQIRPRGLLGKWVKYNEKNCFNLFIPFLFTRYVEPTVSDKLLAYIQRTASTGVHFSIARLSAIKYFSLFRIARKKVDNITYLMIFAVFDPSPLAQRINCSFSINYM